MNNNKVAIISGVAGQDGAHLSRYLLSKDYRVVGLVRRSGSTPQNLWRLNGVKLEIVEGDITDRDALEEHITRIKPDELYNLAAQSHVGTSFSHPWSTFETNVGGFTNILETVRKFSPNTKIYQASSSEMFGVSKAPQNEDTPFKPVSPYGVSKLACHELARYYRNLGLFVSCGILFNHEGEYRGDLFVTQKIVKGIVRIIRDMTQNRVPEPLKLGNLSSIRDFGYADDYVQAMYLMLQHDKPDDFVVATNTSTTIQDFLNDTINIVRRHFQFDLEIPKEYILTDPGEVRKSELWELRGDYSKINKTLGWKPVIYGKSLIELMVGSVIYGI